jgi:hypothetical protein
MREFDNEDEILLGMLTAIDRDANTSQRNLSAELGVALGLANAYLKRCAHKGWIKIQQVPPRRYTYYLTAQGFTEKTRLTGQYLSSSFTFFRRARAQMSDLLQECSDNGWNRIAFAGISELAEIGTICAGEFSVELVGVIEPSSRADQTFYGFPVYGSIVDCPDVDAVIITALNNPHALFQEVHSHVGAQKTLIPAFVKLALPTSDRQIEAQMD